MMSDYEQRPYYFTEADRRGAQQVSRTFNDWQAKREALEKKKALRKKRE